MLPGREQPLGTRIQALDAAARLAVLGSAHEGRLAHHATCVAGPVLESGYGALKHVDLGNVFRRLFTRLFMAEVGDRKAVGEVADDLGPTL